MGKTNQIVELESVVVKFVGDSGDGMQLAGTLFSDSAALSGNDIVTFPDFPAEIRAPHNTVAGVSGFQVHISKNKIYSTGDLCDLIVALNPASLKANMQWIKKGGTLIVDADAFNEKVFAKSGYASNPLEDDSLLQYNVIKAPITSLTKAAVQSLNLDNKTVEKTRNMFALGMVFYLFNIELDNTIKFFQTKFKKKPLVVEANTNVLTAGYNFADTIEAISSTFSIPQANIEKGKYRNITGNVATAWGFLAASEKSGRPLYLGSYPITPATEILMELAKHKSLGARVLQAEDEIAGICSTIGAAYTGSLAITTTSGPGLSLKSEAIGLAVMTELPIVIVDVQRAGPSTGLPTKSEQSDLLQVLYGRNGECPVIVTAAATPADCFYKAYEAAKLAMEHMTPVILLTEGYIGFGSELFKIPKVADLDPIKPPLAEANDPDFMPFRRNEETLARKWALPGTEGLRHRVGGLEKENITGNITTDPINHELMIKIRMEKVMRVANYIPEQEVYGEQSGELLVVSWGSTYGTIFSAINKLKEKGIKVSHAHFKHIMPLPKNTEEVFGRFKKIIVCELNSGQFVGYLRMTYPDFKYLQYNKVQALPFTISELSDCFIKTLEG
ncbi:MAG: MFS transporter [Bacteroidetes bacterium GWE2_29_8]|nr:MAG: MFS transporter [Bacteroidetes bacterium GWE2_29_8]OFY24500.1 MAG: MFS transporter [Bacteroidetes bacterium GWF2_29_10]